MLTECIEGVIMKGGLYKNALISCIYRESLFIDVKSSCKVHNTYLSNSDATRSHVPLTDVPYDFNKAMLRFPTAVVRLKSISGGVTFVGVGTLSLASVATVIFSTVPRNPGRNGSSSTGSPYLYCVQNNER